MRLRFRYRLFSTCLMIFLGAVCTRADNILTVNGSLLGTYADLNGGGGGIAFSPATGWFHWTDTYTNYSGTERCGSYGCRTDYTADFDGGVITGSYRIQNQTYLLQGQIVSGHIIGISCVPEFNMSCPPQGSEFRVGFQFVGVWNNGWLATGDIGASGTEVWGIGSYRIDTQSSSIPEPATLFLFGSSTLILTGVVRRRLRM